MTVSCTNKKVFTQRPLIHYPTLPGNLQHSFFEHHHFFSPQPGKPSIFLHHFPYFSWLKNPMSSYFWIMFTVHVYEIAGSGSSESLWLSRGQHSTSVL